MLAQKPPMGWNSWNTFGYDISEKVICEMADVIVDKGLKDAGYEYVVIDDCWSERERDPITHRLVPDHVKFPNGMKAVADYVHSKGLKFGIYSCAGVRTCGNFPGSFDHEFIDAETFAEWGVDFLKYDFCHVPEYVHGATLYRRMGQALRLCGREILFSACNWGSDNVWSWIRSTGAHMYRSTGDIFDNFKSMSDIARSQIPPYDKLEIPQKNDSDFEILKKLVRAAGGSAAHAPGCWNDIDMLTVGMFGKGNVGTTGCDATDYKTQFALWCLFGSPLMLGADLRTLDDEMLALIKNKGLIAISQDGDFRPAFDCDRYNDSAFARLLDNGDIALGFFNFSENDNVANFVYFENLGLPFGSGYDLHFYNAITGEDMGIKREGFLIEFKKKHDCLIIRAKPVKRGEVSQS